MHAEQSQQKDAQLDTSAVSEAEIDAVSKCFN